MIFGTIMAQDHYGSSNIIVNYTQLKRMNDKSFLALGLKDTTLSYGYASLDAEYQTGNLRRAQQAYSKNNISFYSEGFKTLKRIRLSGNFLFGKSIEDSLANSLKRDDDDISPYYYFASKNGHYERQNYKANALLDYELIKEKLNIGSNINFETHWTVRTVDPRPNINDFKLVLSPQASYQLKNQKIGLGFNWGYGYGETSISFKNSTFLQSLAYPDRIHRINRGCGYISRKDTTLLRRYEDYAGAFINYQLTNKKYNIKFIGSYNKKVEENTHDVKSRTNYYTRSRFTLNTLGLDLLITKFLPNSSHQIYIKLLNEDGYDWNVAFKKGNYIATDNHFSLSYNLWWDKLKKLQQEAELTLNYESIYRKDAVASHLFDTQNLKPELSYTLHKYLNNADQWIINAGTSYRKSLNTNLNVPSTQINVFTKGIVFPDYYYYDSDFLGLKTKFNYITDRLIENIKLGFSLSGQVYIQTTASNKSYDAQFIPKGNRLSILGSINLYL